MADLESQRVLAKDMGTDDLLGRTARGGTVYLSLQFFQMLLRLALMAILARLLTPQDYGLFAMVYAISSFLALFSDSSFIYNTIQKHDLNLDQLNTMFWVNWVAGIILTVISAAISPLVALLYHEPKLIIINLLCSIAFMISSASAQHRALLIRRMQFLKIGFAEVATLSISGLIAVIMALKDYGVYSLAGQLLFTSIFGTAFLWVFSGWAPGLPVRGSGVRNMIKFGGYLAGTNFANYFARNLDNILIGRYWGSADLGIYSRAYNLMMLPAAAVLSPIHVPMVSALSKVQHDIPRFQNAYLRSLRFLALLTFPIMTGLFILSNEIIAVVYGPKWASASPIFRILCIAGFWQSLWLSALQIYLPIGRPDKLFKISLVSSLIVVLGFIIGVRWGVRGVSLSYAITISGIIGPYLFYAFSAIGLPIRRALRQIFPPFIAALAIIPGVYFIKILLLGSASSLIRLIVCVPSGVLIFLAILFIISPKIIIDLKDIILNHLLSPFLKRL